VRERAGTGRPIVMPEDGPTLKEKADYCGRCAALILCEAIAALWAGFP
jgi:hypothetical protein